MESELIALDITCTEAERLKNLLSEFSIMPKPILFISVYTDSRSTIEILKKDNANKKMTYSDQTQVCSTPIGQSCALNFIKSEKNIVDPLTKRLSRSVVLKSSKEIGLSP